MNGTGGSSRVSGKIVERVFRIDPALDRVTPDRDVLLLKRQGFPCGNGDLLLDNVDPRDKLGDSVLDL